MTISSQGVDTTPGPNPLQGVLAASYGKIAINGDYLYTDHGEIFSQSLGVKVGTFNGAGASSWTRRLKSCLVS